MIINEKLILLVTKTKSINGLAYVIKATFPKKDPMYARFHSNDGIEVNNYHTSEASERTKKLEKNIQNFLKTVIKEFNIDSENEGVSFNFMMKFGDKYSAFCKIHLNLHNDRFGLSDGYIEFPLTEVEIFFFWKCISSSASM